MDFRIKVGGGAIALAVAMALAPAYGVSAASDAGPTATVRAFLTAISKGDVAAAQATNTDDVTILDEIPPFAWHGPDAFKAWLGDFGKDSAATGQTDTRVQFLRTVRSEVQGDAAYVVVKVDFTYREHGRRMAEPAQMAVSLRRDAGAWKIYSWAWAGGAPQPAAAAKPAASAAAKPAT